MSAQKNRAPKSCANSYQILQNVNDGSVITRPLRCNRNDCPICSHIHKEEMKERIEAAQKDYNLQYMLTISPELIDKSNANDGFDKFNEKLERLFDTVHKLYPDNRNCQQNNDKYYIKRCKKFANKTFAGMFAVSRYKKKTLKQFEKENPRAYKNFMKKAEKTLEEVKNTPFRFIKICELSSLKKSTKDGIAIHYHILSNVDISDFLHNELNGKVSVCEVYNGEKLADYLTKTADYKTYDLWYESFGRIRRRFSASKINGVSIISPKDKKNDDSLKDYEMIERMTFYGAAPKGVFPDLASLEAAMANNLKRVDVKTEKAAYKLSKQYIKKSKQNGVKQLQTGHAHEMDATEKKNDDALLKECNETVYMPDIIKMLAEISKETIQSGSFNQKKSINTASGLSSNQRKALEMFGDERRLMVLTGFAGTGKSYVVEKFLEYYDFTDKTVQITSNAQIIAEKLGEKIEKNARKNNVTMAVRADNVCRLLRILERRCFCLLSPQIQDFIKADLIIVEEASMLSFEEIYKLLKNTDKNTKILLLGDTFQLGSFTSEFNVLDIFTAINYPGMVELDICYRQAKGSRLLDFATKIRENKDFKQEIKDCSECYSEEQIQELYKQGYIFLCATNSECAALEKVIFGKNRTIGKDKKLMITKNYQRYGLTNGMICTVHRNDGNKITLVKPDGKKVRVDLSDRNLKYSAAEIMTIHKSQGLEFDNIALVIKDKKSVAKINHNALYTAVTRAVSEFKIMYNGTDADKLSESLYRNRKYKDMNKLKVIIKQNAPMLLNTAQGRP